MLGSALVGDPKFQDSEIDKLVRAPTRKYSRNKDSFSRSVAQISHE